MHTSKPWWEQLQAIQKRPAMYLGNTDHIFTSFLGFVAGYQVGYAAAQHGFMTFEQLVPADFSRFVTEYFGHTFPAGGKGWGTFISEHTASEQEAFEMFFRLREEYEKRHSNAA